MPSPSKRAVLQWGDFLQKQNEGLQVKTFQADVDLFVGTCSRAGVKTALDLGAGNGRFTQVLAAAGIRTVALDIQLAGLTRVSASFGAEKAAVAPIQGTASCLPLQSGSCGAVLAVRSLSHGTRREVAASFREVARVLQPGGLFFLYMTSAGDFRSVIGKEVEPNVHEPLTGPEEGVPHFFPCQDELRRLTQPLQWVFYRRDLFPVPRPTAYFDAYPVEERERMKAAGMESSHHCVIARKEKPLERS